MDCKTDSWQDSMEVQSSHYPLCSWAGAEMHVQNCFLTAEHLKPTWRPGPSSTYIFSSEKEKKQQALNTCQPLSLGAGTHLKLIQNLSASCVCVTEKGFSSVGYGDLMSVCTMPKKKRNSLMLWHSAAIY